MPGRTPLFQLVAPSTTIDSILPSITLIAPSVQDVVNLRAAGAKNPAVVIPFYFAAREGGGSFLVEGGDTRASLSVWGALLAGEPVLYPADSAYYEQVFHAGLPFSTEAERREHLVRLVGERDDFAALISAPDPKRSARLLLKLLARA